MSLFPVHTATLKQHKLPMALFGGKKEKAAQGFSALQSTAERSELTRNWGQIPRYSCLLNSSK